MSERDITWLVGQRLTEVHCDDSGRWSFTFTDRGVIFVECPWRLVAASGILISSCDHLEQYGLPAPIDAGAELLAHLSERPVTTISILERTADVTITFTDDARVEIITFSTGYEAWETLSPTGVRVIAQGRGKLAIFCP